MCPGLDGFGGAYYRSQVPFVTVVTVSVGVGYRHTVYPETLQSVMILQASASQQAACHAPKPY